MVNHFDMAREAYRLRNTGKSGDEIVAALRRMFPTATSADYRRAERIALDREEIVEEERQAAARAFVDKWHGGAPAEVIDGAIRVHLKYMKLQPNAEALFPNPDKSKS